MPNHFEFNDDSFDSLVENDPSFEGSSASETVETVEAPVGEYLVDSQNTSDSESDNDTSEASITDDNFLMSFLSEYGLQDGKVTYENEDGSTEEVPFDSLDPEEKVNILKELTSPNLSKDEVEVINYLRSNNATIHDVISYYSQKAVDDYIKENGSVDKQYSINEYTDDEIYIADLKAKFSDMTDEDIKADLETAKENESLFKKKVDIIRKQYIAQEEEEAKEAERAQQEQFNQFKTSLKNQLNDFNEISMDYKDSKSYRLQIEDSEKEEIYRYILSQDEEGKTKFFKDLNDPKMLVELAWFALYGKDAFSDISNYWKSQLKSTRRSEPKSQTTVVHTDRRSQKDIFTNHRNSVETEYGDDLI